MPDVNRLTLERGRAKYAYDCAIEGRGIVKHKEYKQYVKKTLPMIKTNGLGATLAFIKSKSDPNEQAKGYAYYKLNEHLKCWLNQGSLISVNIDDDLVKAIISIETSAEYRAITIEVLAFLKWLRRFVEGLIEGEVIGD